MAKSIDKLLVEHRAKGLKRDENSKMHFKLLPRNQGKDVYNLSAPFTLDGALYLLARVEARDSELSEIGIFTQAQADSLYYWQELDLFRLKLQDPFFTFVNDEIVIGGVEVDFSKEKLNYRTVFYRGKSLDKLERFAVGPWGMKDIRLKEIPEGILLLTRPQGKIGGRGTIGWTIIKSLDELTIANINSATLLDEMFVEGEWGGANEIHITSETEASILGHIAKFDEQRNRHYYASVFNLNFNTGAYTPMKIIAERQDFAKGEYKRKDLIDVIFSGGLLEIDNDYAYLFCGLSDAEAHFRKINNPLR